MATLWHEATYGERVLSEFERKTLDLGVGLYESTFGCDLRRFNSRADEPSDSSQSLASLSRNQGPPIHRTEWGVEFFRMTGHELDLEEEAELLEWWLEASSLLIEIASLCWEPVPTGLRASVYDEDDVGPLLSYYIPHTREGRRPSGARLADLRSKEFWPELDSFVKAARSTPAYAAVVDAAGSLGKKDRRRLQGLAREVGSRLDEEMADIGYDEERSRAPALVAKAYDSAPRELREFAQAVQAYNELLNHAFWTALAITESDDGIVVIDSVPAAMRLTRDGRYEDLTPRWSALAVSVFSRRRPLSW